MALTIAIEGTGVIANCDAISDTAGGTWYEEGGGSIALSEDMLLVGSASIGGKYAGKSGCQVLDKGSGLYDFTSGGDEENQFLYIWIAMTAIGTLETLANYGLCVRLSSDPYNTCDTQNYVDFLNYFIEKTNADFIHFQNSAEIEAISENRERLKTKYFLPSKKTIKICQDKFESYKKWQEKGLPQPKTLFLNNEGDLEGAFKELGNNIWLREIKGSGGKGSLLANNLKQAKAWVDFKEGWGKFTAAEYLSPQSITWQSIWEDGELIVAQTRKRLYWELAKISPSGISGATGGAITVSDPKVDETALKAILAVDYKPHGILV